MKDREAAIFGFLGGLAVGFSIGRLMIVYGGLNIDRSLDLYIVLSVNSVVVAIGALVAAILRLTGRFTQGRLMLGLSVGVLLGGILAAGRLRERWWKRPPFGPQRSTDLFGAFGRR